jgi:hypothetical protein
MSIFSVLIYIVSLVLYSLLSLNIHNQCEDIHLSSPVYFIHGGKWRVLPDQEIVFNAVMQNCLEFDSGQNILNGVLVYKIQRQHTKSNKLIQSESKCIQLLVAWHVDHTEKLCVRVLLVEHDEEFNWDEDKLRLLHQKCWHLLDTLVKPIGSNWLLRDTTLLATTAETMNDGYGWDIFISEGMKDNVRRPFWMNAAR